ncbi:MAG TPA: DUF6515 family protein [Holophaga sp.]|nr:DUF6515 family protein [Holophaga sp.]
MTTPRLFVSGLCLSLLASLPVPAQGRSWHGGGGPRPGSMSGGGPSHGGSFRPSPGPGTLSGRPSVSWHGSSYRSLPGGYHTYHYGGRPWYFHGGHWYRPWRGAYLGWYPPVGIWLDVLPIGYTTLWWGPVRYYVYENVYYRDSPDGGYITADPPEGREGTTESRPPSQDQAALDALLITPKEGQSAERMRADRADAQRYALRKSGYDPAYADPSDPGTPRARRAYLRAMREYLETRGYDVH